MKIVNIHEAKAHFSKLVDKASKGESFVIAKAGKPIVKVTALYAPTGAQMRRLGFMAGSRCQTILIEWVERRLNGSLAAGL